MALRWAAALLVFVVYTDVVVEGCLSWGEPKEKGPCEIKAEEVEAMLNGPFEIADLYPPTCDEDGYYTPKQCLPWPGYCECVDKEGQQIGEYHGYMDEVGHIGQDGTWEDSKCDCAREAHEATMQAEAHMVDGMFVPRCDWKGDYDRIQCRGSRCYCVDDNLEQVGDSVNIGEDHLLPCAPQLCAPVMCEMFCPSGFAQDDSGCQVCRCIDDAPLGRE